MTPERSASNFLADWERDIENRSSEGISSSLGRLSRDEGRSSYKHEISGSPGHSTTPKQPSSKRAELFAIEEKRKRLLAEESPTFADVVALNTIPSPRPVDQKRSREEAHNSDFTRLSLQESWDSPERRRKRVRFGDQISLDLEFNTHTHRYRLGEGASHDKFAQLPTQEYEIELDTSDGESDVKEEQPRIKIPEHLFSRSFAPRMGSVAADIEMTDYVESSFVDGDELTPPPTKFYSAFILALIKRRPEMTKSINVRCRPTALDMWKRDDQRRAELHNNT